MLQGLRDDYLRAVGTDKETIICNRVKMLHGELFKENNQWNYLWKVILRYFYPTIDNIFQEGSGGLVRSNEVYSSDPSILINDYVDFFHKSVFPENTPWKRAGFATKYGMPIERSLLDVETLRYADNAIDMCRYWLKEGGFYEQSHITMMHDALLGNSAMQAVMSWEEISFMDVPISRLGIGRDSVGRLDSMSEIYSFPDWEILKKYGERGLELFRKPKLKPTNDPLPTNAVYGRNNYGAPPLGFNSNMKVGFKASTMNEHTKEVIRLYAPNAPYSMLPHNPEFLPEMAYLCFLVTYNTGRLLDVEAYPTLPFGVSRGLTVQGEKYGRGLGNLLLPDVAVLNSKKKVDYQADAIQSQSPLLLKGSGFLRPPGETLKPNQLLRLHQNTTLEPLYQRPTMSQNAKLSYEAELEGLRQGLRKERIDVALADRMTATEYTKRQDSSWGLFAPAAGRIYKQIAKPCLESLLSWLIITEKLPPMPPSLMSGEVKFNIELFSIFSFGQESEQGQNLARAFGPMMDLVEGQPELLDNFNADGFLRSSLSRHELSKFVNSKEVVQELRDARMKKEMALQKQQLTGTQKGQQLFDKKETERQLQQQDGSYTAI